MNVNDIIISPILTEKSTFLKQTNGEYVFKVHRASNKILIKNAIKEIFNVDVTSCRIINHKPKPKRRRMQKEGYTSTYKKAIITLKKNQKIDELEA